MPDESRPQPQASPAVQIAPPTPTAHARWPLAVAVLIAIAFAGTMLIVVFDPRAVAYTEDAYVAAHYATIAPRVTGQISAR
jgi:membrane fusion protein (multidrug efflux system)